MGPEQTAPPLSVAVIGHVNHGKTALVRALTGIETDRLAEEKARGLSITLGFAWRDYAGCSIDFLDAPGHEDFLRAMVTGAAGARAALLVVSSVEGVAKQTREHLRIAHWLGVRAGIVAVTKSDLMADGGEAAVRGAVADALRGSFLAGEPMVFCSSVTGAGLDGLHAALAALSQRCALPPEGPGPVLAVDRVFSLAGAGTVVTGTLQGGTLRAGDPAVLMPAGRAVTLRGLQRHGRDVPAATAGGRVAAALRGVAVDDVQAGDLLCAPGVLQPSLAMDVEIELSPDLARSPKSGDEVRVLWGARQDIARLRLLEDPAPGPGGRGLAQLRFTAPVATFAGARAILRRLSPPATLGGVLVLDPTATRLKGRAGPQREVLAAALDGDLRRIADRLAARDGGIVSAAEAARLGRRPVHEARAALDGFAPLDDDRLASPDAWAAAREAFLQGLADGHAQTPVRVWTPIAAPRARVTGPGLSRALVEPLERTLAAEGVIRVRGAQAALSTHDPLAALTPPQLARMQTLEAEIRLGGPSPPERSGLAAPEAGDGALLDLLVDLGVLVVLRNHALRQWLTFHVAAFDDALEDLRRTFPPPTEFTTGQARATLGTSRKFIVPILEHLDARGDTRRRGDLRQVL